jgi:hypothetical protein
MGRDVLLDLGEIAGTDLVRESDNCRHVQSRDGEISVPPR